MIEEQIIVTTGRKVNRDVIEKAQQAARELGGLFVVRGEYSLEYLHREYETDKVVVVKNKEYLIDKAEGSLFFHPSMAHLRIKNLRRGTEDHMIEAMGLKAGMSVLDCTLGFAADAIVASFVAGESGQVRGVEVSPLIAFIIRHGLKECKAAAPIGIEAAMRRIEVCNEESFAYLCRQPDKSVDVVYFDPMFRHAMQGSAAIKPLRDLADHRPVSQASIDEARRVARSRIVIKEASYSQEFERLGCNRMSGGKYSKIHYGIIDIK